MLFSNGTMVPLGVAFVQETTVFREFGPLAGSTMRLAYDVAPKIGNTLSRQTFDVDARYYQRLGAQRRARAALPRLQELRRSRPTTCTSAATPKCAATTTCEFVGQNVFFAQRRTALPDHRGGLTPIGVIGGIRGVFFANMGGGWFNGQALQVLRQRHADVHASTPAPRTRAASVIRSTAPAQSTGFRLVDGRASYGIGLETFALGFPIHFDWSWRTLFNKEWEDVRVRGDGGSAKFRKPRFAVWIGYDF